MWPKRTDLVTPVATVASRIPEVSPDVNSPSIFPDSLLSFRFLGSRTHREIEREMEENYSLTGRKI